MASISLSLFTHRIPPDCNSSERERERARETAVISIKSMPRKLVCLTDVTVKISYLTSHEKSRLAVFLTENVASFCFSLESVDARDLIVLSMPSSVKDFLGFCKLQPVRIWKIWEPKIDPVPWRSDDLDKGTLWLPSHRLE